MPLLPFRPKSPASAPDASPSAWGRLLTDAQHDLKGRRESLFVLVLLVGLFTFMRTTTVMTTGAIAGVGWLTVATVALVVFQSGRVYQAYQLVQRLRATPQGAGAAQDAPLSQAPSALTMGANPAVIPADAAPGLRRTMSIDAHRQLRMPTGEAFANTAHAESKGWLFYNQIGRLGDEEIPQWAQFRDQWFEYEGLHQQPQPIPPDRRVFGQLRYRKLDQAPMP